MWGQGCLLARRLAEAGAAVINVTINTPKNGPEFTNWDDHIQNAGRPGHFGQYMTTRLPYLDAAYSSLIEDIFARGLDRKILVVAVGEFGRTPRLSHNINGTGRVPYGEMDVPQAGTYSVTATGSPTSAVSPRVTFGEPPWNPFGPPIVGALIIMAPFAILALILLLPLRRV